jgi:HipA-like protein
MAKAGVYNNGRLAGIIGRLDGDTYYFTYTDEYFKNPELPAISLNFPKSQQQYAARELFPFFFGLLAEGINKDIQCRLLKIDENDDFTRLIKTAGEDTIGAITVKELTEES